MGKNNLDNQLNNSIKLAHLELDPAEKQSLLGDVEEILGFVQNIKKAEKAGEARFGKKIAPQDREFPQIKKNNVLREDVIDPFENSPAIIKNFPQKKENLIKVKKI
jgi:aspartyl/glutamyl-tRNA(Asn/Gln) amidotransferase C subunit